MMNSVVVNPVNVLCMMDVDDAMATVPVEHMLKVRKSTPSPVVIYRDPYQAPTMTLAQARALFIQVELEEGIPVFDERGRRL